MAGLVLSGCAIGFRGPAVGIDHHSATLTGDVLSNRTEGGAWWFEYGKTASYGQQSTPRLHSFVAGDSESVGQSIDGLEPATTYHYRLCAEDKDPAVDALCSGDQTFTTTGDYVRGSILGMSSSGGFGTFTFNDVRSGPAGENPTGSITASGPGPISGPVTCLTVTGDTKVTVGVASSFFFFELPIGSLGAGSAESIGARDPTVCPPDPTLGNPTAPVVRLSDFTMHDDP